MLYNIIMILLYCILLLLAINSPFILLYILRAIKDSKTSVTYNPSPPAKITYKHKQTKQRYRISRREKVSRNLNLLRILEGK